VGGLWVLGSASEDINLSLAHRIEVVKATAEASAGRIPLIVGSGLTSIDDILHYMDRISGFELDGIHVLPYDTKIGEGRLIHLISTLADKSPFPIWMYHNPKRGRAITEVAISELKDHSNVGGVKMGGYSLSELTWALMHRSDTFDVLGAGGGQMFQMLALGAEAHTTSEASAFPELFVDLYNTFISGDWPAARAKQFRLIRLSRSFPRTDNGEYAAEEKYILSLRGICADHVNPAYRRLNETEKAQMRRALQDFGFEWAR